MLEQLKQQLLKALAWIMDERARQQNIPSQSPEIAPQTTQTTDTTSDTTQVNITLVEHFALCIKNYEGFYAPGENPDYPNGTRAWRNNSPGNVKYSSVGYLAIYEPVRRDPQNFAIFKDYATGWLYLVNLLRQKFGENPNDTIVQFMQKYAPTSDGNDPVRYASYIASHMGVSLETKVGTFL